MKWNAFLIVFEGLSFGEKIENSGHKRSSLRKSDYMWYHKENPYKHSTKAIYTCFIFKHPDVIPLM